MFTDINTALNLRNIHSIVPVCFGVLVLLLLPMWMLSHDDAQMVSDRMASLLRQQITTQSRETRQWRLAEPINPKRDVKLVHGTPIVPGLNKLSAQMGYVQLTACITSKQQTEVRDARGNVIKPFDEPPVVMTDYWVWERPLGPKPDARWRLVGMVNPYQEVAASGPQGSVDPGQYALREMQKQGA